MPFHSPAFAVLCAVTLAIYYLGGPRWQHAVLLVSSVAFYYYAGLLDTVLLVSTVLVNHVVSAIVARGGRRGRVALVLAIVVDLGVLAFFKYRAFVVSTVNATAGTQLTVPSFVIPLGV